MKSKLIYTLALSGMLFSGCTDWLDVNQNPNYATQEKVTSDMLLTYVEQNKTEQRINSIGYHNMCQHLTKSGDYSGNYVFLTGSIMPQNVNTFWSYRYERMANLMVIKEKAIEANDPGYNAIASTLMVIDFRELVDMFGNVPYTEALKAAENLAPKYDKGADVYNGLINDIEEAIQNFDAALADKTYSAPGLKKADILFAGNLEKWKRYAYSIELSLLMRISNVQDVAAKVNAIKDKCLSINELVSSNPGYYKSANKMNPNYETWGYTYLDREATNHKQYVPTSILVDFLRNNNDPRLRVYVSPRVYLGEDPKIDTNYTVFGLDKEYYIGVPYGQMTPATGNYASKTGLGVLGHSSSMVDGPTAEMFVMSGSLVGFYLAEAALRNMIPGGDEAAKQYYEEAVTAAFNMYEKPLQDAGFTNAGIKAPIAGSAAEAAREYLDQDNKNVNWDLMTSTEEKMCAIQTQKWLSLFMIDPLEAWSEQRRTDYPVLQSSNCQAKGNKLVARFPYPDTEKNLNPTNHNAEGEIDVYTSLVFWDLKNDDVKRTEIYQ